ncbi:hypothetical protein ACXR2U_19920 [Jatrophihabitans sp. YIM 134969]
MADIDSRAVSEVRIPAAALTPGDLVNTSPGGDDDWQSVVGVYIRPADTPAEREDIRDLLASLGGRYVLVELTDIAPVDANVYFTDDGAAMLYASDEGADTPVVDVVSAEDGVRTYLYTKFELVTVRAS